MRNGTATGSLRATGGSLHIFADCPDSGFYALVTPGRPLYLFLMSVQEIEKAVARLSPAELSKFSTWFEEYLADVWDREFEADVKAGKLDALGRDADRDFEAGRCQPL